MTSVIFMGEDAVRRLAYFGLQLGPHDGLELRGVLLLFLRRRVDCCCCAGALFSPTTSKPDAVRRAMPRATIATLRPTAAPLEGRGICAGWDGEAGALTVWAASKAPHQFRTVLAGVLGLDEERIRVIVPNVGGGFGVKLHDYPEDVLACVAAMRLRRNVRWIEAGREHFVAPVHAREQTCARAGGTDPGGAGARRRAARAPGVRRDRPAPLPHVHGVRPAAPPTIASAVAARPGWRGRPARRGELLPAHPRRFVALLNGRR